MGVLVVNGNLLDSDAKYICHQVNCQGKMGSGVARAIREKFPVVFHEYNALCSKAGNKADLLGTVQMVRCRAWEHEKFVCNLFGQLYYGYDGECYTDYEALEKCMRWLRRNVPEGETIAIPYGIGCGLGGADWFRVSRIIKDTIGASHNVELWRLNSNERKKS